MSRGSIKKSASRYGPILPTITAIMETVDGQDYYFFDRPFTAFELGNAAFAKDPFYAQFLIQLQGQKAERWFFSFSFLAHMGMGYTAFGNGPTANDIGIISESQAFPNSWINGYGRVDGDRAFVGKIFFGYYLSQRLFLSASIKYRDGNPFAFINAFKKKASGSSPTRPSRPRTSTARRAVPGRIASGISISSSVMRSLCSAKKAGWNCRCSTFWISACELSENVFSDESRRLANELQLPRSLRLGVVLEI